MNSLADIMKQNEELKELTNENFELAKENKKLHEEKSMICNKLNQLEIDNQALKKELHE